MVKEKKIKAVEELEKKIEMYDVIGLLDIHKLPSRQYQEIQKQIRGEVEIVMTKKSVLTHAIEISNKPNIKELEKFLPTQPVLIFTKLEPFKFYMTATKMKSPTYAKEGDISDDEILISAGPTGLMPGPVISEFSKVGILAGVEEGKIAIKRDKVVAKRGDVISKDLANVLRKLRIQPIKVGLNIVAVYDRGTIYLKDVLSLAGQGYIDQTLLAHQHAINLSVAIGYPTKENIKMLLAKAYRESQAIVPKVKLPEPASAAPQQEEQKTEAQEAGKQEETEKPKNEEVKAESDKNA